MRLSSSSKMQRASARSSLTLSSSSSRKRAGRRSLNNKIKGNDSGSLLLSVVIPGCNELSSISPSTLTAMAVVMLSMFILMISRLNCFHIHYGLSGSLRNLESIGSERGDGYTDFHFTGNGKTTYDQEALDILKDNPHINIKDLDLGFVFDIDQFGVDPLAIAGRGRKKKASRASKGSLGKPTNELLFHITGERIRNALQKQEAEMPRPTVQ